MHDFTNIKGRFPIISERVELRLFQESDINEQYIGWLNDYDVVRYSNQRFKQHTLESCYDYFRSFDKSTTIFVAVYSKDNQNMIGTMTIYFNLQHSVADIGIMLGEKSYWGKGLGKECWQAMIHLLISETCIRKITGGTLSCNRGMLNIMKQSGMQEDGIRKHQELVDGQPYDIIHFALFNPKIEKNLNDCHCCT